VLFIEFPPAICRVTAFYVTSSTNLIRIPAVYLFFCLIGQVSESPSPPFECLHLSAFPIIFEISPTSNPDIHAGLDPYRHRNPRFTSLIREPFFPPTREKKCPPSAIPLSEYVQSKRPSHDSWVWGACLNFQPTPRMEPRTPHFSLI